MEIKDDIKSGSVWREVNPVILLRKVNHKRNLTPVFNIRTIKKEASVYYPKD